MRLTLALLFKKLPNGNIFHGKHRLTPKIRARHAQQLLDDIRREERNMFLLRHPYLTAEQSFGHTKHLRKGEIFLEEKRSLRLKYKDNIHWENVLNHLRCGDKWE